MSKLINMVDQCIRDEITFIYQSSQVLKKPIDKILRVTLMQSIEISKEHIRFLKEIKLKYGTD